MQSTVEYNKENMFMQYTQMMFKKLNANVCTCDINLHTSIHS